QAAQNAGREFAVGCVGVGAGATTQNLKGGFGAAVAQLPGGGHIAAFAAVNPGGRVTFGDGPHFRAATCEQNGEFGGLGFPESVTPDMADPLVKTDAARNTNTTLGVIVTDIQLTKAQLKRVAITAHDGLAIAIYPVHTPFDGDIVFALSTTGNDAATPTADPVHQLKDIGAIATTALARAIALGVYIATAESGDVLPTWQDRYASVARA
ncbi:MAG: P1 family peptidase, partial [Alphaproteobacteria bacterium]